MASRWKNSNESDEEEGESNDIYRENNHVYFYTDIDRTTISRLNVILRQAEEHCVIMKLRMRLDVVPIYLHIFSNGGCIHSAFATMDLIQSLSTPVYSVIEGSTASAGTLISIICEKRFIRPLGHMLIHQLSSVCWGKMSEITDEYHNLKDVMKKLRELYLQHTKLSSKKLDELLRHDLWLDAKQSIAYGLVDELYM